jgi:hypothetical protein
MSCSHPIDGVASAELAYAVEQGRAAAAALLGAAAVPYLPDHYFWTEQFEMNVRMFGRPPFTGEPEVADTQEGGGQLLRFGEGLVALNYTAPVVKLKRMFRAEYSR